MKRVLVILCLVLIIIAGGVVFWQLGNEKPANRQLTYAALGDSVAAGYGLPAAKKAGQTDVLCSRSPQAYPALTAGQLKLKLTHAACSGATTAGVLNTQNVSGTAVPSQLETAFAGGTPHLISLTVGANDARWTSFIEACYSSDCDTATNTATADAVLPDVRSGLKLILNNIKDRAHGQPPRTVVTGYYDLLAISCYAFQPYVTESEVAWFKSQTAKLNTAIKETVNLYDFARYAQIDFKGHDLCSDDPWIQGITDAAPLHPAAEGQAAIAKAITAAAYREGLFQN